jgi:mannose-6-phosphate isomerase-like protein (cupin superfamily)
MKKINSQDVPEVEQSSPNRKYHLFRRHLTAAITGKRDAGVADGGHPFDLELTRIPAGASNFPLHQHYAQWEMYVFLSGSGEITDGQEKIPVHAQDVVMCPPETPHKITNTGTEDLVYYVIADNPYSEVVYYPERQTWGIKPHRKHFEMKEVDYFQPGD